MLNVFLFLAISVFASAQNYCNPNRCPLLCCTPEGFCADSLNECTVCVPSRCWSGCCNGNVCDPTGESCDSNTKKIILITAVFLLVFVTICVLLVCLLSLRKPRAFIEPHPIWNMDRQGQPEPVLVPIPIYEVEAIPHDVSFDLFEIEDNDVPYLIMEIDHKQFKKWEKEDAMITMKNGLLVQDEILSKGVKPSPEDDIKNMY